MVKDLYLGLLRIGYSPLLRQSLLAGNKPPKSANLSLKRQVRARSEHNTKITVFMGKETLQSLLVRQFGESS
jgi:hypothetical protein